MPSGRTHDSITLWSLPLVAGLTFGQTQSSSLTLLVSGGYLFGGLMFGPDLDIYSRQYKRWGPLRWIWLPYRRAMHHRSFWSHGPIVGTIVRVGYLMIWIGLLVIAGIVIGSISYQISGATSDWSLMAQQQLDECYKFIGRSFQQFWGEWVAFVLGLELGALSHSLSDWAGSAYKRFNRRRKTTPFANQKPPASVIPPLINELPPPTANQPSSQPLPPPLRREPQLPTFKRLPRH